MGTNGFLTQLQAEDSEKFKTIVEFECRGLEPVDFQPQVSSSYLWLISVFKSSSSRVIKYTLFETVLEHHRPSQIPILPQFLLLLHLTQEKNQTKQKTCEQLTQTTDILCASKT